MNIDNIKKLRLAIRRTPLTRDSNHSWKHELHDKYFITYLPKIRTTTLLYNKAPVGRVLDEEILNCICFKSF